VTVTFSEESAPCLCSAITRSWQLLRDSVLYTCRQIRKQKFTICAVCSTKSSV